MHLKLSLCTSLAAMALLKLYYIGIEADVLRELDDHMRLWSICFVMSTLADANTSKQSYVIVGLAYTRSCRGHETFQTSIISYYFLLRLPTFSASTADLSSCSRYALSTSSPRRHTPRRPRIRFCTTVR